MLFCFCVCYFGTGRETRTLTSLRTPASKAGAATITPFPLTVILWCACLDLNQDTFRKKFLRLPRLPFRHKRIFWSEIWVLPPINWVCNPAPHFSVYPAFILYLVRFEGIAPTRIKRYQFYRLVCLL